MSKVTIGSLHDLGYTGVDYTKADTYTSSHVASNCVCNRRLLREERNETRDDVVVIPLESYEEGTLNGTSSSEGVSRRRRKLSEEGLQTAINFGQSMLLKSKTDFEIAKIEMSKNSYSASLRSGVKYVGANVVSVLYREGKHIYGVIVTNNS